MTMTGRSVAATLGMLGLLAGCQVLSGLSGLHETGATGSSSSTGSTSTGGTGGMGGMGGGGGHAGGPPMTSATATSTSTGMPSNCKNGCGMGTCDEMTGTCSPYPLFTEDKATSPPRLMVSNGNYLYLVIENQVWMHTLPDGDLLGTYAPQSGSIVDIAATADNLLVLTNSDIRLVSVNGQDLMNPYVPPMGMISALHTYADYVWWDQNGSFHYAMAGLWPAAVDLLLPTPPPPALFDVDADHLYWWTGSEFDATLSMSSQKNNAIFMNPGATVISLSADSNTSGSGYLYWAEPGTANAAGAIRRALKVGGTSMDQTTVTSVNSSFTRVVAGAKEIIWTDGTVGGGTCQEGAFVKRTVIGSTATTQDLTVEQTTCPALAQDAQAFYYNEGTTIMRVVKTP